MILEIINLVRRFHFIFSFIFPNYQRSQFLCFLPFQPTSNYCGCDNPTQGLCRVDGGTQQQQQPARPDISLTASRTVGQRKTTGTQIAHKKTLRLASKFENIVLDRDLLPRGPARLGHGHRAHLPLLPVQLRGSQHPQAQRARQNRSPEGETIQVQTVHVQVKSDTNNRMNHS